MGATLSNYALLVLRLVSMVVLTRQLFLGFSSEAYGFWALLWSIFAYALLLDFGLGTALQKYTSQWRAGHERPFGALLSTAAMLYGLMGLLMAVGVWAMTQGLTFFLPGLSPERFVHYRHIFWVFGLGTALLFPSGCFVELLRGMEALVLRNAIQALGVVLHLLLSLWALAYASDPLMAMVWVSLGVTALVNTGLAAAFFWRVRREHRPLTWALPRWRLVRELLHFSLFAWMITLTNLVIFRTDQLVISGTLGLAAVAGYQIVQRVTEMYRQYTTQLHDVLGPQVAVHFQKGDHQALRQVFLRSQRWVFTLVLWSFGPLFWGLPLLLEAWLNLKDPEVLLSGRILLFSMALQIVVRSTSTQVMLMCQQERVLMRLAVAEAVGNLVLSVLLAPYLGIVGVALGTLIPNLFVTLGGYLPLTYRFLQLSMAEYLKVALIPISISPWVKHGARGVRMLCEKGKLWVSFQHYR